MRPVGRYCVAMGEMAIFPLGSVLLPGEVLPLHVFEPRYRQMVSDLLAEDDGALEFTVVLIERGSEVGGGDHRSALGTAAVITHIEALDGGRYALVAVGRQRMRITQWLPDAPYPRAHLEPWPDPEVDLAQFAVALEATRARVYAVHHQAVALGDIPAGHDLTTSDDPLLASYQLASLVPLGPSDRQEILGAFDPFGRLDALDRALDDLEAALKFRAS